MSSQRGVQSWPAGLEPVDPRESWPVGYFGKHGYRRARIVAAPMPVDQGALRVRRQRGVRVVYGGAFDLAVEVDECTSGLCERAAALAPGLFGRVRDPVTLEWEVTAPFRHQVDEVSAAVVGLARTAAGLVAESDSVRRTAHLGAAERVAAREALAKLTTAPEPPVITDRDVAEGVWSVVLVGFVAPWSGPLADVLGSAWLPEDARLNGRASASERVEAGLRLVDRACRGLDRVLSRAGAARRVGGLPGQRRRPDAAEVARAKLDELGVPL